MSERIQGNGGVRSNASDGTLGAGASDTTKPSRLRRPLGAVFASAVDGAATLMRKHVELARIEITEAVSARAKGAGLMAAAAALGLFALGFAAASGSAALDLVLPAWAAHLIVSFVFVAIAGGLVLAGRRAIQTAPTTPERTQETLKEDTQWAKRQIAR